ncbi:MAG: PepSY domain-containing protein [Gammaproteobacteria bacterium]|nr:PepSY domain-containing protein [Gammaproteobacteria bacterium]
MSPYQKKQLQKKRNNIVRKWHRRVGMTAMIFLINLAVTGILLNHYEALSLHKKYIQSDWLISWYGVQSVDEINCINASHNYFCQLDDKIYFKNGDSISSFTSEESDQLFNATGKDEINYMLTTNSLYLFNAKFQLIDQISRQSIDLSQGDIEGLTTEEFNLLAEPNEDQFKLLSDPQAIDSINQLHKRSQITHLKFVQDLHSGQLFFSGGTLVSDLMAIIIILLGISGIVSWQKRINRPDECCK